MPIPERFRIPGEFQNSLGGDEVLLVLTVVRVPELLEALVSLAADALELAVVGLAVDLIGIEAVEQSVQLLVERLDLSSVTNGCSCLGPHRCPVGRVESFGDGPCQRRGQNDLVYRRPELLQYVVFEDVELGLASVPMDALSVSAPVVPVRLAAGLRFRGVGDLARAPVAGERERADEEPLVLPLAVSRLHSERSLELVPLVGGEDGLVLALVPSASPDELALVAVVRVGERRVEAVLQVARDERAVVPGNEPRRHEPLVQAGLADAIEAPPLKMEFHLPAEQSAAFRCRTDNRPTPALWSALVVQRGLVPVEVRRPARVPTVETSLLHAVDGLEPSEAVVGLGLRDVDVEHEEDGGIAVAVQDGAVRGDVNGDLALRDQVLKQLGIGEVPSDSVVDVEHDVLDALGPRLCDAAMELGPKRRLLRRLLERPGAHHVKANPLGVFP